MTETGETHVLSRGNRETLKRTPRPAADDDTATLSPQRKRPSLQILTPPRVVAMDPSEADCPAANHASWPSPSEMRTVRACPSPSDTQTTSPVSRALHARRRCVPVPHARPRRHSP